MKRDSWGDEVERISSIRDFFVVLEVVIILVGEEGIFNREVSSLDLKKFIIWLES